MVPFAGRGADAVGHWLVGHRRHDDRLGERADAAAAGRYRAEHDARLEHDPTVNTGGGEPATRRRSSPGGGLTRRARKR
jgi:hypothetical protein